ncbi:MAG: hypothetical protein ACYDBI_09605 [Thermoplasmataceae archaeon]
MHYLKASNIHTHQDGKSMDQLYDSNDLSDLFLFYDSFDNTKDIVDWMIRRPKVNGKIVDIDGDDDIVVVVPTIDSNSEMFVNLREKVFPGLRIVAVESGKTPFFSYSRNVNKGISHALKYKPRFVIVSNDDMYRIDHIEILLNQLSNVPDDEENVIYTQTGNYNSYWVNIGKPTLLRNLFLLFNSKYTRTRIRIEEDHPDLLSLRYMVYGQNFPYNIMIKPECEVRNVGSFSIYSQKFLQKSYGKLLDETYINGMEDIDLSLRILSYKVIKRSVDYRIGSLIGKSLGKFTSIRTVKQIVNSVYFNYKLYNGLLALPIKLRGEVKNDK